MNVKERQRWAKDNPARNENDLAAKGYAWEIQQGGQKFRTILSIDLFKMPIAWRAQIFLLAKDGALPVNRWPFSGKVAAIHVAQLLLSGVGDPQSRITEFDEWSVEISHKLTAEESEHVARAAARPETKFKPVLLGQVNAYDPTNSKTQVGDGLFQPEKRSLIYG